jgi:hypothetical protein
VTVAGPPSAPDLARDLDAVRGRLAASDEAAELQPLSLGGVLLGSGVLDRVPGLVGELLTPRRAAIDGPGDRRGLGRETSCVNPRAR